MKANDVPADELLAELDMALSEDYGCSLPFEKFPTIHWLVELLKDELKGESGPPGGGDQP